MIKKTILNTLFLLNITPCITQPLAEKITDALCNIMRINEQRSYIGEAISQQNHALQAGHFATKVYPNDSEFIIAALFHDIAHQIQDIFKFDGDTFGAFNHGPRGAKFLKNLGFSEKICYLVEHHAKAKRYLARDATYYQKLSAASKHTLVLQGGIMKPQEAQAFEQDSYFEQLIALRKVDDKAKQKDLKVAPNTAYKTIIINHLTQQWKLCDNKKKKQIQTFFDNFQLLCRRLYRDWLSQHQ